MVAGPRQVGISDCQIKVVIEGEEKSLESCGPFASTLVVHLYERQIRGSGRLSRNERVTQPLSSELERMWRRLRVAR